MPATITTTVLNKTFNRKTDFMGALDTALGNAGFGSNIETYDIRDLTAWAYLGSSPTTLDTGNAGSLVGRAKTVTLSGATCGTVQINIFSRTAYSSNWGGVNSPSSGTENCFIPGSFICYGGWNTSAHTPTSSTAGNAIGGYIADYSGCLTQNTGTTANQLIYLYSSGVASGQLPLGHQYNGSVTTADNTNYPYNFTNPIFFTAINHSEIRGVFVNQFNRPTTFIGYVRPATLPSWWNENSFPYCFQSLNSNLLVYRSFYGSNSPFSSNTIYSNFHIACPAAASTIAGSVPTGAILGSSNTANSNKRDVMSSPFLLDTGTGAIVGKFSSDIVLVNYTGLAQFDNIIVTAGVEQYTVLSAYRASRYNTGNTSTYAGAVDNSVYGIAIRTV
jgi:hypothetical protein